MLLLQECTCTARNNNFPQNIKLFENNLRKVKEPKGSYFNECLYSKLNQGYYSIQLLVFFNKSGKCKSSFMIPTENLDEFTNKSRNLRGTSKRIQQRKIM